MPDGAAMRVTAGIVTKNRPDTLLRTLSSLTLIGDALADVIVVDDTSDAPIDDVVRAVPPAIASRLRCIRQPNHEGYIVARNTIVREAATEFVLLMDDDAWLVDGSSVTRALTLLANRPNVGAVAFAMATANGAPWDARMQPAPVDYACYVPSFIGFAHALRRDVFLRLGGYREAFQFYGEEKEYCLRLLDAGFDVIYLPDARAVHVPHAASRNHSRYLRLTIRNDCLSAIYNEPLPVALVSVPIRLLRYRRFAHGTDAPGGLRWIAGDMLRRLPSALRARRPVKWATLRRWRRLRREWPPYEQAVA
jgi:GT2 family glycosyltransferase